MKSKQITLTGNKQDAFIKLIASQFGIYADCELKLIKVLVKFDMFAPFDLNKNIRILIQKELNCPYTTLSSSLRRLIKANVIARSGKNCYFNIAFRHLDDIDAIVFKAN